MKMWLCTKDYTMENGEIAFSRGVEYEELGRWVVPDSIVGWYTKTQLRNNQGNTHTLHLNTDMHRHFTEFHNIPIRVDADPAMKVAYISGPYRAGHGRTVLENIRVAEKYAIKYWREGYAVVCPHLNTAHFDGVVPDARFLEGDLEFIKRLHDTDAMVMLPNWMESKGAIQEQELAMERGLRIIYEKNVEAPAILGG